MFRCEWKSISKSSRRKCNIRHHVLLYWRLVQWISWKPRWSSRHRSSRPSCWWSLRCSYGAQFHSFTQSPCTGWWSFSRRLITETTHTEDRHYHSCFILPCYVTNTVATIGICQVSSLVSTVFWYKYIKLFRIILNRAIYKT